MMRFDLSRCWNRRDARLVGRSCLALVAFALAACTPSKEPAASSTPSTPATPPKSSTRTYSPSAVFTPVRQLAEFTENGVRVTVSLEADAEQRPLLRATFTPIDKGFHLYGKDMPEKGVSGIGVPTRFEVAPDPALKVAGATFSDLQPKDVRFETLGVTLPTYPEGPVTLRVPVEWVAKDVEISARLSFGYMACKTDGVCLPPVKQTLDVKIPKP